jgi:hypothetical protein
MARLRLKLTSNDDFDDDVESVYSEPADQLQYGLYADWTSLPYTKEASEKLHDKVANLLFSAYAVAIFVFFLKICCFHYLLYNDFI